MKVQRFRGVELVALSYSMAVLLLFARVPASSAGCTSAYFGDGDCDDVNNSEECGYDGGDCCEESCVDGLYLCGGKTGFKCLDPDYSYYYGGDDDEFHSQPSSYEYSYSYSFSFDFGCEDELIGNGQCDWHSNNKKECVYDGGDCCEESCVDGDFSCSDQEYDNCLDPEYRNYDDDYYYSEPSSSDSFDYGTLCRHERLGNGYCDDRNNNPECGYDDGDCCQESCVDGDYTCSDQGTFYCIDPEYSEEEFPFHLCNPGLIGNGYCDSQNNTPDCGYDDGDCCEESCVDGDFFMCADQEVFYCIDPEYSEEEYPAHLCNPETTGNGYCDAQNNKAKCGYDDGDCCEESCVDGDVYMCGDHESYYCLDPDYAISDDDFYPQPSSDSDDDSEVSCQEEEIGNGYCDPSNNSEDCGYDGGDCCSCTCSDAQGSGCGGQDAGDTCVDPRAPCMDGYVEVGTLTTVTVSASLFDKGPLWEGLDECMPGGCSPQLTRDGEVDDLTSRWSCTDSEYLCVLTFSFEEPQDIDYVQVAFYKADELPRGLDVSTNGVDMGHLDSSLESTFTAFSLFADAVATLTLTSNSGLYEYEGISFLEVRLMVKDPDA